MPYNPRSDSGNNPLKSCFIPRLILYMVAVVIIGSNLRSLVQNLNVEPQAVKQAAIIKHKSNRTTTVMELLKLNTNSSLMERNQSIGSFFDCNRNQSKCRYFYPGEFYHHYFLTNVNVNQSIIGSSAKAERSNHTFNFKNINASDDINERYFQWRKRIGLENANLPALDSLSWWAEENDASLRTKNDLKHSSSLDLNSQIQDHIMSLPQNITYIHVHKCGGTSIQSAMYRRARQIRKTRLRVIHDGDGDDTEKPLVKLGAGMHTYKHSYGGGSREKKEKWDGERLGHIHAIANAQSQSFPSSSTSKTNQLPFPIFTVVRDPIERFLSATQQVMHYNTDFREKCLHELQPKSSLSSLLSKRRSKEEKEAHLRRQTIQCAIQDMEETNYRRDVHLVPISSHFRLLGNDNVAMDDKEGTRRDIAVSVFSMEDIQDVLLYLGSNNDLVVQDDDGTTSTSNSTKKLTIHARDRSNVEYATSSILAKLSSNDCDEEMIQQICSLYHVDVELMKWLGFGGESVEKCE